MDFEAAHRLTVSRRQHLELHISPLIGERRLSEEFATADEARENAAPQQQYGPSL